MAKLTAAHSSALKTTCSAAGQTCTDEHEAALADIQAKIAASGGNWLAVFAFIQKAITSGVTIGEVIAAFQAFFAPTPA